MTPSRHKDHKGTRPRISAKDPKLATILVGPAEEKFVIHEELLTYYSGFFRAALTGRFKEAEEKTVHLKDDNTHIFEFFVHWLYHQRFPVANDADELYKLWKGVSNNKEAQTNNLIRLHVFGDTYDVPKLKVSTMTTLCKYALRPCNDVALPKAHMVRFAFENLPEGSPLCTFLVDTYCDEATKCTWTGFAQENWPSAFISRVLCQYTEYAFGKRSKNDSICSCDYHNHKTDEERRSCHEHWRRRRKR
ncbi:uncharacterized protein K460DRAFT_399694 [Cucurbitaria berberidis CBS 394.84]|uniref:BTB domain-containing protein n=1 Tax=Cucurbitaria berberidis CBS 394.84 TaxID=1168544 RepID=A0A9P4LBG7_9PLEO|nr:uncharacterized protein K460DRAFT_399694 [Cucurbitaria berberidis CBS 394.84]KAF1849576.1 hypothetical protein K460DRAFT_399694 [Cucurbitaria berberidis CBS 394.84]